MIRVIAAALLLAVQPAVATTPGAEALRFERVNEDHLERPPAINEAETIRFLSARVADDPLDFLAKNRLAAIHLRRHSRDGDQRDLASARTLAEASLANFKPEDNPVALAILARVELASHRFAAAARHARRLASLRPGKHEPRLILFDALLESGDYAGAEATLGALEQRGREEPGALLSIEARRGRLAWLHGETREASGHYARALEAAYALPSKGKTEAAWCLWQIGTMAFARGDLTAAESAHKAALAASPGYARAVGALARLRAAQGYTDRAVDLYRKAIALDPDILFVAALGDLYALGGQTDLAEAQYARVESLAFGHAQVHEEDSDHAHAAAGPGGGSHDHSTGPVYHGRGLALFLADHAREPQRALALARREFESRQDVYTADALAWAALQAGDVEQASRASKLALALGTPDPKLYYHAARVAQASGDARLAAAHLERALALNPRFDPIHAPIARRLLEQLRAEVKPNTGD